MSDAASHFAAEAAGEPAGPGRFVHVDDIKPAEFVPGLEFRPVLGDKGMANFVHFGPDTEAPRHVHEEEQIVVVLDGEFTFDIDGEQRVMRKGDAAVVPSWVPHGAWTTGTECLEVDFFSPPRTTLVALAEQQTGDDLGEAGQAGDGDRDGA